MTEIIKINSDDPNPALNRASIALHNGGIISFPTETFYGLGANAFNKKAVNKVFLVKRREYSKPLLLLIASVEQLYHLTPNINRTAKTLIDNFWPGPLTLLFEASPNIPKALTASTGKIGVRISGNRIARKLCQITGFPITGSSANISNNPGPDSAAKVIKMLGDKIDMVLDGGGTPGAKSSTMVDVSENIPKLIRQGVIEKEEIEEKIKIRFE